MASITLLTREKVAEIALANDPAALRDHALALASDWLVLHSRLKLLEPQPHERLVRVSDEIAKELQENPSRPVTLKVEQQPDGFLELIATVVPEAVAHA